MLIFKYTNELENIKNPIKGEMAYVPSKQKTYVYDGNEWFLMSTGDTMSDAKMNLYEMNQIMVKELPVLDITEKELKLINQLHNIHENQYYMLLCNDIKYYTILKASSTWAIMPTMCETFGLTVIDCLKNVGDIKSIDLVPDNSAIEIWLENAEGVYCMYLFPYNEGVVEFRG